MLLHSYASKRYEAEHMDTPNLWDLEPLRPGSVVARQDHKGVDDSCPAERCLCHRQARVHASKDSMRLREVSSSLSTAATRGPRAARFCALSLLAATSLDTTSNDES